MSTLETDLNLLRALLWQAMPDRGDWSGPAALACEHQIESLLHEVALSA